MLHSAHISLLQLFGFLKTAFRLPDGGDWNQLRDQFTDPAWVEKQSSILSIAVIYLSFTFHFEQSHLNLISD